MADQPFFATQTKEQQWELYLNQQQAVSPGLELWRRGNGDLLRTPLESWRQLNTPVPHPLHRDYSSIEMAKRKQADAEQRDKQKKKQLAHVRIHGVEQRAPWVPPEEYLPFQRSIPNIKNFTKPLRVKMPKGFY